MALNLGKAVADYLATRPEQKFSARQIAEWIFETYRYGPVAPVRFNPRRRRREATQPMCGILHLLTPK